MKKAINSFNSGEISPYLYARTDFEKYHNGCLTMENFLPLPYGGAVRRPAAKYLGEAKDSDGDGDSDKIRLIPFVSSISAAYQLELGDAYIRFWKNGARINDTETDIVEAATYKWTASGSGTSEYYLELLAGGDPSITEPDNIDENGIYLREATVGSLIAGQWDYGDNDSLGYNTIYVRLTDSVDPDTKADGFLTAEYIYEVTSPYDEDALDVIKYAQSVDVMWFVDGTNPVYKLSRFSDTLWTMAKENFTHPPFLDENDTSITMTPSATSGTITLTSSDDFFNASHVGAYMRLDSLRFLDNKAVSGSVVTAGFSNSILISNSNWNIITGGGSWTGRLVLQKSTDNTSWEDYVSLIDTTSGTNRNITTSSESPEDWGVYLRLQFTGSGTITYELKAESPLIGTLVQIIAYTDAKTVTAEVTGSFQDVATDYEDTWGDIASTVPLGQKYVSNAALTYASASSTISGLVGWNSSDNGKIVGLCFDGTNFWLVTSEKRVYQIDSAFTAISGGPYDISAQFTAAAPTGIAYYNSQLYITQYSNKIVKYDVSPAITYDETLTVLSNILYTGIEFKDGYFFLSYNGEYLNFCAVLRFYHDFTYEGTINYVSGSRFHYTDIVGVNSSLYVIDRTNTEIDKYSVSSLSLQEINDLTTTPSDARAIGYNNTNVWIIGTDDIAYKYTISTKTTYYVCVKSYTKGASITSDEKYWQVTTPVMTTWSEGAFSNYRGHPKAIALYDNRLCYGGTSYRPNTIWLSQTDDYPNFLLGSLDTDAMKLTMNSGSNDEIQWMVPQEELVIGTSSSEWTLGSATDSQSISPTSFNLKRKTTYGSGTLGGMLVNSAVLFPMRQGRKIREWKFQFDTGDYVAPDLSILAEHITTGGINQWAYQQQPDNILWIIRADGTLLGFTYERDQNVMGWHRHTLKAGSGVFESVSVLPSANSEDEVWATVKITINGNVKRYICKLNDREWGTNYLTQWQGSDLYKTYTSPGTTILRGLDYLEGETLDVVADGVIQDQETVSNGQITVDSSAYTTVTVGLPMTSKLAPVYLEAVGEYGPTQGSKKNVHKATVRFKDTFSAKAGRTATEIYSVKFDSDLSPLYNGDVEVTLSNASEFLKTCYIVQSDPMPCEVLAMIPKVEV